MGFYKTDSTKSQTLLQIVEDIFIRFNLNFKNLRGQCYDDAANMSGNLSGLKTLILQKEPRALFVHCNAHNLNLIVQDAMENVTSARTFIGIVKELIYFIRDSPHRLRQFEKLQSENGPNLTPFCPTR